MPTGQTQSDNQSKSGGPARSKTASAARRKTSSGAHKAPDQAPDAIELLTQDHRAAQKLFKDFEQIKDKGDDDAKLELAEEVCLALTVHMAIEEEIFYPEVRKAIDDKDIMDESVVEHQAAKDLIREIEAMEPEEELFDARVHVLSEEIDHHIEEEEGTMFPEVKKTRLDLKALGQKLAQRKQELMEELAGG